VLSIENVVTGRLVLCNCRGRGAKGTNKGTKTNHDDETPLRDKSTYYNYLHHLSCRIPQIRQQLFFLLLERHHSNVERDYYMLNGSLPSQHRHFLKSAGPAIQREEPFSLAQYHYFNKVTSIALQSRRNTRFLFLQSQSSHNNRFEKIIRPLQVENTKKEMHWHEHHGPMPKDSSLLNLLFCHAAKCVHDKGVNKHANDNPRQVEELRNHLLDKGVYLSSSLVYHTAHNEEPRIDFYGQAGTYIVSKWSVRGCMHLFHRSNKAL